jgi:hypothetical protein
MIRNYEQLANERLFLDDQNDIENINTLRQIFHSNSDMLLSTFKEIVDDSGYSMTGRWDSENECPEII